MNRLTKDLHNQYKDYWYREDLDQVCDKEQIVLTKLGQLEDIEEKRNISLLDDLDKKLTVLEIIKKHKLLNYVLKNEKCANMYHLSKEECDLLREIENEEIN